MSFTILLSIRIPKRLLEDNMLSKAQYFLVGGVSDVLFKNTVYSNKKFETLRTRPQTRL